MNKRQRAVYELLKKKPKVKAFGFNDKELKGVAAKVADNLTSDEEASDEDVKSEVIIATRKSNPHIPISFR